MRYYLKAHASKIFLALAATAGIVFAVKLLSAIQSIAHGAS